jgi:hypothetical protein
MGCRIRGREGFCRLAYPVSRVLRADRKSPFGGFFFARNADLSYSAAVVATALQGPPMSPTRKRVSEPNAVERVSRIVEMKLPLPWLISTATVAFGSLFAVLFQIRETQIGQTELRGAVMELRQAVAQKNEEIQKVQVQSAELRIKIDAQGQDIARIAADVSDLRRDQHAIQLETQRNRK